MRCARSAPNWGPCATLVEQISRSMKPLRFRARPTAGRRCLEISNGEARRQASILAGKPTRCYEHADGLAENRKMQLRSPKKGLGRRPVRDIARIPQDIDLAVVKTDAHPRRVRAIADLKRRAATSACDHCRYERKELPPCIPWANATTRSRRKISAQVGDVQIRLKSADAKKDAFGVGGVPMTRWEGKAGPSMGRFSSLSRYAAL
jgi:hypothetical protein